MHAVHCEHVRPFSCFLLQSENGPLEAAWGIAAMARSLEMLKGAEMPLELLFEWLDTTRMFTRWYKGVVHPEMQYYVEVITQRAVDKGIPTVHGNWHSSIAEAWMAVGVLTDNSTLYQQGVDLYLATVKSYFRWGRQKDWMQGRILGECSETLRDIYHTQVWIGVDLNADEQGCMSRVIHCPSRGCLAGCWWGRHMQRVLMPVLVSASVCGAAVWSGWAVASRRDGLAAEHRHLQGRGVRPGVSHGAARAHHQCVGCKQDGEPAACGVQVL